MLNKIKFLWEKGPTYVIFWVAQKCNFTCEHCFNHEENKRDVAELSLEEINEVSKSFGHIKYLTLAGGEPFINREMKQIAECFIRTNKVEHLNVITNGWFKERIIDFCDYIDSNFPHVFLTLNISLDGPEEVHDRIRQKNGSYKRCIDVISELKGKNYRNATVAVNGVYNRENANSIESFALSIIGEQEIPFAINLVRGETIQNEELRSIDIDHYLKVARNIFEMNKKLNSSSFPRFEDLLQGVQSVVLDIIEKSVKEKKRMAPCQAGKKGIVLTADGDILLCEILGIRLGNIRNYNYDIMGVLNSEKCREEVDKIELTKCHCTWECFQSLNTVYTPKLYPKVVKASL